MLANCDGNFYLPILYLPRVELHCKLQENFVKSCKKTGPSIIIFFKIFSCDIQAMVLFS